MYSVLMPAVSSRLGREASVIERVSRRFERYVVIIEDGGTAFGQYVGNH